MTVSNTDFLTVNEVAAILGLYRGTVYKWAMSGKLPCRKFGSNTVRFLPAEIDMVKEELRQSAERKIAKKADAKAEREAKVIVPEGYMFAADACKLLNISKSRLWQLVEAGQLTANKNRKPAILSVAEIEAYIKRHEDLSRDYVTASHAAKVLGISIHDVQALAKAGFLEFHQFNPTGKRMLIKQTSLYMYKRRPDLLTIDQAERFLGIPAEQVWALIESNTVKFVISTDKQILIPLENLKVYAEQIKNTETGKEVE
jgi:excisionase family DNA binding protein